VSEYEVESAVIKVRIVRRKSDLVLVQWEDDVTFQRAWITSSMIREQVDTDFLLVEAPWEGVPYGERWDLLLKVSQVTPEKIDRELKRKDIWTIEDLQLNPSMGKLALSKVIGLDIVTMLNTAALKQQATGGNP